MEHITPFLPWIYWILGLFAVLWISSLWIRRIPSGKIAILENVVKSKSIATGRILAEDDEMGVLQRYLKQGWHVIPWPVRRIKYTCAITNVAELAVLKAKDGAALPPNRKFADDPAGNTEDPAQDHHNRFQDAEGFYRHGGIRGIQLRIVTAGPYFFHPELFEVIPISRTVIPPGKVGVVTARDGAPLEAGQNLGKRIDGHDHFQNAAAFIRNGGQGGPQIEILPPGTYNINTEVFGIEIKDALVVPQGKMAVLIAKIGKPLPTGEVCAETPAGDKVFTDAHEFITAGGVQGPQSRMLGAGTTYYNPLAFDFELKDLFAVQPGFVAARISYIGKEPEVQGETPAPPTVLEGQAKDPAATRFNTGGRELHIVGPGYRGLQREVLSPNRYAYNPYAEQLITWPISVRTVEWANPNDKDPSTNYFNQFLIQSNDGQDMRVDVRMTYRVNPEDVPAVLRAFGSPEALEQQVIHPLVENIFRNQVTKSPAINYVQNRDKEVEEAFKEAQARLREYHVQVTALLITNLIPPEKLTAILSAKSLAEQEKDMYAKKEEAQKARITYENRAAEAEQQKSLRQAETDIVVAQNEAKAVQERAKGEAARVELIGRAEATATQVKGEAEASIIEKKGLAAGKGFESQAQALGRDGLALLEVFRRIAEGGTKVVPDIVVGGGTPGGVPGADISGMLSVLVARSLRDQAVSPAAPTQSAAVALSSGAAQTQSDQGQGATLVSGPAASTQGSAA